MFTCHNTKFVTFFLQANEICMALNSSVYIVEVISVDNDDKIWKSNPEYQFSKRLSNHRDFKLMKYLYTFYFMMFDILSVYVRINNTYCNVRAISYTDYEGDGVEYMF